MGRDTCFSSFLGGMLSLLIAASLVACARDLDYQEPQSYLPQLQPAVISYLSLAFPDDADEELALQIALVKYKHDAAEQEYWLLRHQVPYRWIWVELNGEVFNLLVAGPYEAGPVLAQQRRRLQQGLGNKQAMPVMALGLNSRQD